MYDKNETVGMSAMTGSDNLDFASEIEENFRQEAIKHIRALTVAPSHFDGATCVKCGEDIPENRLKIGKFTCIPCQELLERNSKLFSYA